MGLIKRKNGNYQARIKGVDGRIICDTFPTKKEALHQLNEWKLEKRDGLLGRNRDRKLTVAEYFSEWHGDISSEVSRENQSGWRHQQKIYFRDYIDPVLGRYPLNVVTPQMIKRVLIEMAQLGRAPQTQRLVYSTLKKMFGDAVENYQYLTFNPVLRKIRPAVPVKEAPHLNLNQAKALLEHVEDKKYGLAIWIQLFLGLRAGELMALRFEDIDLEEGRIFIRRTYVKKTQAFRDYPKGGKHHSHSIPIELLERLRQAKATAKSALVVSSQTGDVLPYRWYLVALKKYCAELGLPKIASHGLRHSTSELYIHHGATRDDLRRLFAHSSPAVTDRYVHDLGTNLERVANVIRLFPTASDPKVTPRGVSSGN